MNDNNRTDPSLLFAQAAQAEGIPPRGDLGVGYSAEDQSWTVIVRYTGNLTEWRTQGLGVTELRNGYAIVTVSEERLPWLERQPQVIYVEKPQGLLFAKEEPPADTSSYAVRNLSCLPAVQGGEEALTGKGVLVAVLDSQIDIAHPDFRKADGTSRFVAYWDQTAAGGQPPAGFSMGAAYTAEELDAVTEPVSPGGTGHGTGVLGVAAGNGRASGGRYRGVAYESDLIAVNLALPREGAFPRTTELMEGLEYVMQTAEARRQPLVVNISFGNNAGSHEGDSLLETYLGERQAAWQSMVVIGTGNEADTGGHASVRFTGNPAAPAQMVAMTQTVELVVGEGERSLGLSLWCNPGDTLAVALTRPDGQELGVARYAGSFQVWRAGDARVLSYVGEASPVRQSREYLWQWEAEEGGQISAGIWRLRIVPERIRDGRCDLYLTGSEGRGENTRFLRPDPDRTLTIPSAATEPIAVGAYNPAGMGILSFSGRGYTRVTERVKPELAAPGAGIVAPAPGGGYRSWTGTSFAAPFVAGAAALLMEWGIVQEHQPYLYGESLKAALISGARALPAYPNPPTRQAGYGAICIGDSLELLKE